MSIANIKIIRLISGEELVGEVEKKDDGYLIKNVCQIATSYADPSSSTARIGLAPFLPYSNIKDGVLIKESYVGFVIEPVNELLNEYNKIFGSGIVMPTANESAAVAASSGGNSAFVKL